MSNGSDDGCMDVDGGDGNERKGWKEQGKEIKKVENIGKGEEMEKGIFAVVS